MVAVGVTVFGNENQAAFWKRKQPDLASPVSTQEPESGPSQFAPFGLCFLQSTSRNVDPMEESQLKEESSQQFSVAPILCSPPLPFSRPTYHLLSPPLVSVSVLGVWASSFGSRVSSFVFRVACFVECVSSQRFHF